MIFLQRHELVTLLDEAQASALGIIIQTNSPAKLETELSKIIVQLGDKYTNISFRPITATQLMVIKS